MLPAAANCCLLFAVCCLLQSDCVVVGFICFVEKTFHVSVAFRWKQQDALGAKGKATIVDESQVIFGHSRSDLVLADSGVDWRRHVSVISGVAFGKIDG